MQVNSQPPNSQKDGTARGVRLVVAALILRHAAPDQPSNGALKAISGATVAAIGAPGTIGSPGVIGAPESIGAPGAIEVLICQRRPDQAMALKWEFPGGKIEPGEGAEEALHRELNEELGIHATIGPRVARIRHNYRNGGAVDLQFFTVKEFAGDLENRIFNEVRWSRLSALPAYDFLAADRDLIRDLAGGKLL